MNFNATLFLRKANVHGGGSTLDSARTRTKSSASAKKSKNPEYVKHSKYLRELNFKRAKWWGSGLMGFWALLVLVSSIEHLGSRFFPNATMRCKRTIVKNPVARLWRRYVTIPALFNRKHTTRVIFGGVLPTRFESIVLSIYLALIVIGESVNYSYYKNDTFWEEKREQISRYVGDRSAIMTVFMVNTIYLFAGRNNFLLWLTGWKMSTFYAFHKWIGRMTILSAFVHTITMLMNSLWIKKIHKRKYTSWWRWGSVAMVCGGIMLLQSLPLIRTKFYDVFLYGHIVLALFFLVGVWIHTQALGYGQYIYSVAAIWCFDRFIRILKISQFGLRLAHIKLVGDDILLMTVPSVVSVKEPTPGSFGYVYFLDSWSFFQSHPFSVIHDGNGELKFVIRVKNGITKQIHSRLLRHRDQEVTFKVAIEGYYGEYKTAYAYDQVFMVGGGNGVVGLYEYVKDIAKMKKTGKSNVKFLKFYWVIRHWHNIKWLAPELMKLKEFDFVQPIVYVTRWEFRNKGDGLGLNVAENGTAPSSVEPQHEPEVEENEIEISNEISKEETKIKAGVLGVTSIASVHSELPHVEFRTSRPQIPQILHDDIQECESSDNICIMSCAHNAMCDDVRRTIAFEVGEPRSGRIDLIELLQTW